MNPESDPDTELESRLRAMRWREVPADALAASLRAAQEAQGMGAARMVGVQPSGARRFPWPPQRLKAGHQLFLLVPVPVRWTLAACWALSLGLRLATPASPVVAGNTGAPVNGAVVFEAMQQTKKQIHEFELELALVRR
jgi:hypothetical protein